MEEVVEFVPGAVTPRRIADLTPYSSNARTHSKRKIRQIADSITRFGFTNPVLVNEGVSNTRFGPAVLLVRNF